MDGGHTHRLSLCVFSEACRAADVWPIAAVMIGDHPDDIIGAQLSGSRALCGRRGVAGGRGLLKLDLGPAGLLGGDDVGPALGGELAPPATAAGLPDCLPCSAAS